MFTIKRTAEFDAWLFGLLGDTKPVGEGVHELREDFGPGWRMYYTQRGDVLVVMLGGGDKATQQADIGPQLPCPRHWRTDHDQDCRPAHL